MTRNLYLGADLVPVMLSPTAANVEATFAKVQATDFPARVADLAEEIVAAQPHLIGLQEAALWRTQTPGDISLGVTAPNATTVVYDYLQILLDELANRGQSYITVATVTNLDAELAGIGRDIRFTDRDVLLAKTGLSSPSLVLSNAQTGNYTAAGVISFPTGPVTIKRGWVSVDASLNGTSFRFINTHLESFFSFFPGLQEVQAAELLAGPADTPMPVVLAGDFNSAAAGTGFATPTYVGILAAGFLDGWAIANPGNPGYTCCQAELLDNVVSLLYARIDLILFRGALEVGGAEYYVECTPCNNPHGTAVPPSDHASVAVALFAPSTPTAVPGLAWPGLLLMTGLLAGAAVWAVRRTNFVWQFKPQK